MEPVDATNVLLTHDFLGINLFMSLGLSISLFEQQDKHMYI